MKFSAWILALGVAPSFALANQEPLEGGPHDPYLPGIGIETPTYSGGPEESFLLRQVNVSAAGLNILNDAANEPSLWVDPNNPNRIAIGWRQFDNIASNFRQAGLAYSVDGGETWTNNGPLEAGLFRSDPVLAGNTSSRFFYNSLRDTFFTNNFTSTDLINWPDSGPATGGDKQWMICDNSGGPGDGNLYQCWSTAGNNYGGRQFSRSTDGGNTWAEPTNLPNQPVWGTLDVDRNSRLFIVGTNFGSTFTVLRSTDARTGTATPTWDLVRIVNMGGAIRQGNASVNPAGLLGQAWIAVDRSLGPSSGHVYSLCSVRRNTSNPCDVMLAKSVNGGDTWSAPQRINDDPQNAGKYHWFGTLSIAPGGRLDVIWYDTRASANNTASRMYMTSSFDGGTSWVTPQPMTESFNHLVGFPSQDKIGDYIGMISQNGYAQITFSATFTGGEDVYYMRAPITHPTINGTVTLADYQPSAQDEQVGYQVIYQGNVLKAGTLTLGAGGSFSFPMDSFIAGNYELRMKGRTWLSRKVVMQPTANGIIAILIGLAKNGDVDGDNEIGPGDFSLFANAFLSVDGDPNWNRNADLDGDGEVGPGDFGILAANFGEQGE